MDNIQNWAKTLLTIYRVLPNLTNSIEETTMATALGGFSHTGSAESLFDKIMQLNERKKALINIKVVVDNAFEKMPYKSVEVLKLKFFEKKKFEQIADKAKVCLRTVFRRYVFALEDFCKAMSSDSIDANWLVQHFASDEIVKRIYEKIFEKSLQACEEKYIDSSSQKKIDLISKIAVVNHNSNNNFVGNI